MENTMQNPKKLARFLISPQSAEGDAQIVIELVDGSKLTLTASFDQIEDIADVLDDILDAAAPKDMSSSDQMPEFLRKNLTSG